MSHGPSAEGSNAEPNLTPLLDVVLQLLMFFMMCVNFVTEQVNEDIKLPDSESARPMDKGETDVLFLNLKPFALADFKDRLAPDKLSLLASQFREGDPCVLAVGRDPMKLVEAKIWLRQQYDDAARLSPDGKVRTAIIIRAHKDTYNEQVLRLLLMCKSQGYSRLKLRALTKGGGET
jgi:biopolymer transport protein ExbD